MAFRKILYIQKQCDRYKTKHYIEEQCKEFPYINDNTTCPRTLTNVFLYIVLTSLEHLIHTIYTT